MRRIYPVLGAAFAVAAITVVIGVTSGTASTTVTYMDSHAPIQARVRDLLRRMTLREKVGQMDQIVVEIAARQDQSGGWCPQRDNTSQPQPNCLQKVLIDRRHRVDPVGCDRQSAR